TRSPGSTPRARSADARRSIRSASSSYVVGSSRKTIAGRPREVTARRRIQFPIPSGAIAGDSGVDAGDRLEHDRGALLSFDLDDAVDVQLVAALDLGDRFEGRAQSHVRPGRHGRG